MNLVLKFYDNALDMSFYVILDSLEVTKIAERPMYLIKVKKFSYIVSIERITIIEIFISESTPKELVNPSEMSSGLPNYFEVYYIDSKNNNDSINNFLIKNFNITYSEFLRKSKIVGDYLVFENVALLLYDNYKFKIFKRI